MLAQIPEKALAIKKFFLLSPNQMFPINEEGRLIGRTFEKEKTKVSIILTFSSKKDNM